MTLFEEKVNEYRENKLLQAAHPDIYAECSKKTVYKRFSVI